jgi:SHS2 domain-containing protein
MFLVLFCLCLSFGEKWDLSKHTQGTEVKSVTYSAMKISHPSANQDLAHLWVIIDI